MTGKGMFRLPILLLLGCAFALPSPAVADPPWARLLGGKTVEADPSKTYQVNQDSGPYMIYACSFSGDNAEKQARELVLELRKKYRLEAYLHLAHFRLDDPNAEQPNGPVRWRYRRFADNPRQYQDGALKEVAVLVGNYPAMDDSDAQKTLKKLKHAEPDCLKIDKGKATSQTLAGLRLLQKEVPMEGNQAKKLGPMGHAILTNNPLLPPDYFAPKGVVDEFILKVNKNVTHSLLDCPKKYTVQVARFTGMVTIDQKQILALQAGGQNTKALDEAAEKAHKVTEELRKLGYEAYEFHDRYASIVTVGSFDSVGTPRADGKTEIDPMIHRIMQVFGGEMVDKQIPGQSGTPMKLKSVAGIYFDLQPIPVEVPKRSISRELARRHTTDE